MILETAVWNVLSTMTSVKVFPVRLPRVPDTDEVALFPAIVFQLFAGRTLQAQDSRVARNPRLRCDVWARDWETLCTTSQSLMSAVDHSASIHGTLVYEADISLETRQEEAQTNLYHRVLDFYVWGL